MRRWAASFCVAACFVGCRSPASTEIDAKAEPPATTGSTAGGASDPPPAGEPADADATARTVREAKRVRIDGVEEEWRVEWIGVPADTCFDETRDTCMCTGLELGESGTFEIVRTRPAPGRDGQPAPGAVVQRLRREGPLPHWPTRPSDGRTPAPSPAEIAAIKQRPPVPLLALRDYDGDGRAAELVLQIGAGQPCMRTWSILVGVDRATNELRAFGTTTHPELPLVLAYRSQWEELRASVRHEVDLVQVGCFDHGSGVEIEYHVAARPAGLVAEERTYACTERGRRGALLTRRPIDDERGKP